MDFPRVTRTGLGGRDELTVPSSGAIGLIKNASSSREIVPPFKFCGRRAIFLTMSFLRVTGNWR